MQGDQGEAEVGGKFCRCLPKLRGENSFKKEELVNSEMSGQNLKSAHTFGMKRLLALGKNDSSVEMNTRSKWG